MYRIETIFLKNSILWNSSWLSIAGVALMVCFTGNSELFHHKSSLCGTQNASRVQLNEPGFRGVEYVHGNGLGYNAERHYLSQYNDLYYVRSGSHLKCNLINSM